tara:strand:- start:1751 stop:2026 length:276 start_codon:yes stop_codon:yes gene_type:complete
MAKKKSAKTADLKGMLYQVKSKIAGLDEASFERRSRRASVMRTLDKMDINQIAIIGLNDRTYFYQWKRINGKTKDAVSRTKDGVLLVKRIA